MKRLLFISSVLFLFIAFVVVPSIPSAQLAAFFDFSLSSGRNKSVTQVLTSVEKARVGELSFTLSALSANRRYFGDKNGNVVYLTGSHNWYSLQDAGTVGQPLSIIFDYNSYLNFLQTHHHNFMRMWAYDAWEASSGTPAYYSPLPYKLVNGSYDNNPKYDITQFNQSYFDRLRQRVIAAQAQGIYVSIMLFNGWSIDSKGRTGNPWPGHPFNVNNNINGINGDTNDDGQGLEAHTLQIPAITAAQDAYVKKVIDTVNDLDNVLYEVSNEDPSSAADTQWQYHVINLVKTYEATKTMQHPVGMTAQWSSATGFGNTNADMFNSPADWISPGNSDAGEPYKDNPPAADGRKVILLDTDHLWGEGGDRVWVWKSFTRGLHPLFMDGGIETFPATNDWRDSARNAMGSTLTYAQKMNLNAMTPQGNLASTGYALANIGSEYLFYQPGSGSFTGTLAAGTYTYEWFNPSTNAVISTGTVNGGTQSFTPPFSGDAVLYLKSTAVATFDFSLPTPIDVSVTQGQSVSNTVTATLSSGTSQAVSFTTSGIPTGATYSYSPTSCTPTCITTITIATIASTPVGMYTIVVTGTAGSVKRTTSFTLTVSNQGNPSNPLAHYKLDETSGTTASDSAGANPGNLLGAPGPTWNPTGGKIAGALSFDGVNDYVSISDSSILNLSVSEKYTWSLWVKPTSFQEWSTAWAQYESSTPDEGLAIWIHTTADANVGPVTAGVSVAWQNNGSTTGLFAHSTNNALSTSQFSHVLVTYDGSLSQANRLTIYVNGIDVTDRTDIASNGTITDINPTQTNIGLDITDTDFGDYAHDTIDDVRIYNRALSAAEVQALYAVASPNQPPTVSAITTDLADVDPAAPGLQFYEGTTVTYAATASDPDGDPLTWTWFYTIDGGARLVFLTGAGVVQPAAFPYPLGSAGKGYRWILSVTDGAATVDSALDVKIITRPPVFNFSLSNGGDKSVTQGQSTTNTINVNLISGASQPVTFSAASSPAFTGGSAVFSPTSCVPPCSTSVTLNSGAAAQKTYKITITATGGEVMKTTSFTLTVDPISSSKFIIGDRVQTTATFRVRATPSASGTLLAPQPSGALGTIIGGPVRADGFNWWQVNYDSGADGWSVEYYLIKFVDTAPSNKFSLNDRVQTTANLDVRQTSSLTGALLGTQPAGAQGTITGGPTVADGFNWWQVNYDSGADGWSVEDQLIKFVDTAAPTVSISSPVAGTTYTAAQAVTIRANASDNDQVAKVEFYQNAALVRTDTDGSNGWTYNWSFTATGNGTHAWTARAHDQTGLSTLSLPISLIVAIDNPLPPILVPPTIAPPQTTCNEVPLPPLLFPGAPQDPCASPAAYITYWFYFSLYLAGVAALLIFVAGGVLYLVSGVYPAGMQKATHMMQNALLGIILLFGIWLLLNIINPSLVTLKNPTLPPLTTCFASFSPSMVAKAGQSTFTWYGNTKEANNASLTCTPAIIAPQTGGIPFSGSVTVAIDAPASCTLTLRRETVDIDTCSGSVGVGVAGTDKPYVQGATDEKALAQIIKDLGICNGSADCGGVNACSTINAVAAGNPPPVCFQGCTAADVCKQNPDIHLSTDMLLQLDAMYQAGLRFKISSLTTGSHSGASRHYTGRAVDLFPTGGTTYPQLENALRFGGAALFIQCETKGVKVPCTGSPDHIHAEFR